MRPGPSFMELRARARAHVLLDAGSGRELCGPFDGAVSPWLEPQSLVPQSDDGLVLVRGELDGTRVVVAATEGRFLGGGIGEVSGAKLTTALELAASETPGMPAVLVLDSGGVRLHEANLGLNAVAEAAAALLRLRALAPVVGVIPGPLGCFGGAGLLAGLCSRLVMTPAGRLGLNGPEVIEEVAGTQELDSRDRRAVWGTVGGTARHAAGLVDELVPDDPAAIRAAVVAALAAGVPATHRSEALDDLRRRLDAAAVEPVAGA